MGVPATGAIARTATNFKARASSPIAGIMQSVFLLLFMLLLSPGRQIHSAGLFVGRSDYRRLEHDEC